MHLAMVTFNEKKGNSFRKSVIAGMTAGAFGQLIASPTDLVKVQMQMEGKRVLIEGRQPRYRVNYHS